MTGFCRDIIPVVYGYDCFLIFLILLVTSSFPNFTCMCTTSTSMVHVCTPAGQGTSLGKTAGVSCFLILLVLLRQLFCRFCFFTCAIYTLHVWYRREFIWPFGNFWPWHCSLSSNFYLMLLHPATT
jgi:hypothetical protein